MAKQAKVYGAEITGSPIFADTRNAMVAARNAKIAASNAAELAKGEWQRMFEGLAALYADKTRPGANLPIEDVVKAACEDATVAIKGPQVSDLVLVATLAREGKAAAVLAETTAYLATPAKEGEKRDSWIKTAMRALRRVKEGKATTVAADEAARTPKPKAAATKATDIAKADVADLLALLAAAQTRLIQLKIKAPIGAVIDAVSQHKPAPAQSVVPAPTPAPAPAAQPATPAQPAASTAPFDITAFMGQVASMVSNTVEQKMAAMATVPATTKPKAKNTRPSKG